jgi:sugar phosphate isomerase/epimerase
VDANLDRRAFLTRAALLPAGAAVGVGLGGGFGSARAEAPIKRAGGARLKTSLNAYSFNKALNDNLKGRGKGVTLFDLLDYCAEQNFDALDPTGYFFPGYPKPPADKYVNDFKRRAFHLGLDISGTGVRNNFAQPDKEKRAADVQHVKEWVEVAARLGAPVLRVFAGPEPKDLAWDKVAEWLVEDLKKCVEHGQKYGVLIGIQNHWDFLKTSEQVLKIVKMVDSDWFGTIVDTGYFLTDDPYKDMAAVTPYAVNWQVKEKVDGQDFKVKLDLKKVVRIAREAGYRGYLPIETLSRKSGEDDYDPRARAARPGSRENTKRSQGWRWPATGALSLPASG